MSVFRLRMDEESFHAIVQWIFRTVTLIPMLFVR